jgi:hypothetical protein
VYGDLLPYCEGGSVLGTGSGILLRSGGGPAGVES